MNQNNLLPYSEGQKKPGRRTWALGVQVLEGGGGAEDEDEAASPDAGAVRVAVFIRFLKP
jgi:hypothetical protein